MPATAEKTLARMLRDPDPVAWLAAADMLEEQGLDAESATLRLRADWTRRIASVLADANDGGADGSGTYPLGDGAEADITVGPGELGVVISFPDRSFVSGYPLTTGYLRRKLIAARPDYVLRRSARFANWVTHRLSGPPVTE